MRKRMNVTKKYNELLREQEKALSRITNIQREKDFKLKKIENKYDNILSNLIRDSETLALEVEATQRHVLNTKSSGSGPIEKLIGSK